jgi:predicted O-methyltransferase YrrM
MSAGVNIRRVCEQHHGMPGLGGFTRHYLTLYSIVFGMEAKNVFEFGMGFSTQTIVEALKSTGGKLTTCESRGVESYRKQMDFDIVAQATEMGHPVYGDGDIWTMHQGDTTKIVPELNHPPYDVVLHDGSHQRGQVSTDLNNILPHIKEGGVLLVHDTNHHDLGGAMRAAIDDSNLKNYKHERISLPYSYGLTIIRLLSSKTNERVQINWRPK